MAGDSLDGTAEKMLSSHGSLERDSVVIVVIIW